jgi:hypothetical protein
MWFVSLSNVFVENDLFLIFLDVHVRLDCSFKCSMWHPEKCVTNSSYLLTFMKICNPFLLVYFTCTFFFSFPVLPFSLSFSHRKIAQISLSLVPWKFRFQCEFSTSDLHIDLILASSVAIMPNFLHSLIESRNPKLHLRSHMNGTFQITNLFTIFASIWIRKLKLVSVTDDQTAKICAEANVDDKHMHIGKRHWFRFISNSH